MSILITNNFLWCILLVIRVTHFLCGTLLLMCKVHLCLDIDILFFFCFTCAYNWNFMKARLLTEHFFKKIIIKIKKRKKENDKTLHITQLYSHLCCPSLSWQCNVWLIHFSLLVLVFCIRYSCQGDTNADISDIKYIKLEDQVTMFLSQT